MNDIRHSTRLGAFLLVPYPLWGFPGGSASKEVACNVGDLGLIPGLGRSPEEGNTVVFLSGELYGQRSLVGYSSWRYKE